MLELPQYLNQYPRKKVKDFFKSLVKEGFPYPKDVTEDTKVIDVINYALVNADYNKISDYAKNHNSHPELLEDIAINTLLY